MTHPFPASASSVTLAAAITQESCNSSTANASTIGNLANVPDSVMSFISQFVLPVEWLDEQNNKRYNFQLDVAKLLSLVTKATIGLDKVDNTADADKPIPNSVTQALNNKYDKSEKVPVAEVDGLDEKLQGYRPKNVGIPVNDVVNLAELLGGKADRQHTHTKTDLPWLDSLLSEYSRIGHTHAMSELSDYNTFITNLNNRLNMTLTTQQLGDVGILLGEDEWN